MKQSHAKLFRAFLFALLAAGGYATADLIAQGVCGSPLACFEPGQEGEIWQALTPFGQINDPSCTNSAATVARERGDSRQCVRDDEQPVPQPYPVLMPPSLGQLLDPFAIAVDGERIYISDQSNHRIQAFTFDGSPITIAHPIGDGVSGSGPYPQYPADSRMTGNSDPITGQRLSSPDGLAVDANGKLVVGDYSGYINVFNPDGSPAFGTMASPDRLQIMDTVDGLGDLGTKASGIAMTPGTVVHGFGVTPPPGDNNRIVVTDRLNCFVYIYDSGFNLVRQIPETVPDGAEQGACYWDELAAPLGVFSSPVAAAIDPQGRIYISDYDNNRIQILDGNGDPLGEFGREVLQYPWGIVVDHKGRVAVADTENQRIAFFKMDYSGASPVASYVFELDAKGTLNGYPTAIAEQVGTAAGLDPAGRFLITDTLNNRIQRFQLPDLAIINKVVLPGGVGSFQVVVPEGKAAPVEFVGVSAVGTGATVLTLNGVLPGNPVSLDPVATAQENATPLLGTTIAPGQIVTYNFTFSVGGQSDYIFKFNAIGNGGETAADEAQVDASMPCLDCMSTHQLFVAPGPPTVPATSTGVWYNTQLTVRINATTPQVGGLSGIAYQFMSGPESSGLRWGGNVHLLPVTGNAASIDFAVKSQGVSALRYWAIGGDGTVEVSHSLTLSLDLSLPDLVFTFPAANAAGWNNTAVDAIYTVNDAPSGPATGPVTLSFPNEGRQQFQTVSASDAAGNVLADVASHLSTHAGRYLNIDTTAPVLQPPPSLNITIPVDGPGYAVAPATFVATATDPNLNDARPGADVSGSGVDLLASTLGPGATQFPVGTTTFTFVATDVAGNTASLNGTVTVIRATTTIGAPDQRGQYGQPMVVTASLGTTFATGQVTFTFGPSGAYSVVGSAVGGVATASVPPGLLDVGAHTMQVSYAGDLSVSPASTTAQVTVDPAPITITAQPAGRSVGAVDPPLTYAVTGSLVGTDAFSGGLLRQSGEMPGVYPILRNTLTPGPNYAVTYIGADFTIAQETIEVFATASGKTYGDADPVVLGFTHTGNLIAGVNFSGTLARDAGESVGAYGMNQGNLSLPAGFNLVYHPATFTVNARSVTVTAGSGTKVFGTEDPTLVATDNGFLAADNIVLSQTRASGESVGNYLTGVLPTGAALSNYQVAYVPGNLAITPATVSVSALPQAMTYGDSQPAFTFAYGPLPPAGYSVATVGTAPVCGVQVTQVNVGAHTIQCSGAAGDNLTFVYNTASLTVSPKAVTIAVNSKSRPFATADPAFDAVETGVVPGDTLNYTLSTTAVQLSPVGGYPITVTLGANPNYAVVKSDGILSVTPRPITVTATGSTKVYGDPDPAFSHMLSAPLVGSDLVSGSLTRAVGSNVGSYAINLGSLTVGANYSISFVGASLTITPKAASVTASNAQKVEGAAEPVLPVSSLGFLPSDAIVISASRVAGTTPGTYVITPLATGAAVGNYTIAYTPAVFTIVSANLAPVCSTAYGGEIWPPNHKKFYAAPVRGVTDPEGGPVTVLVTGIWQDEKLDSTGDGQFSPDGKGVGTSTAWVRAERNGHGNKAAGNGRVYEVMFEAADNRGARCTGSVFYTVPHDQGQRATAIDSGARYDSTGVVPGTRNKGQIHQHREGSTEGCSNTKHDHDHDNDWSHNGSKYQGKSRNDNDDDDRCENPQHDHRKDGDWQHRRRR